MAVSGAWTYTESGGNATITDYDTGIGGFAVTVPTTLDGYPVIEISSNALASKSLTSVTINHALNLNATCFGSNGALTVTLSADVTTTGTASTTGPFKNCTIGGNLTISSGVTTIPDNLFYGSSLSSVTFPSTVVTLGEYSFWDNLITTANTGNIVTFGANCFFVNSLTSISLDSASTIGTNAFANNSLSSVTLDNPMQLGTYCFGQNGNITVTLSADVTSVSTSSGVFGGCTIAGNLTVSSGVTTIPQYLFSTSGVTSVTIPNTVTDLELGCFYNNSLTSVTSSSVTTIGNSVFSDNSLTTVDFSAVTSIGNNAFSNNSNLNSVTFSTNNTITFGSNVLSGCTPSPKGTVYGYDSSVQTWWNANYTVYYNFSQIASVSKLKYYNGASWVTGTLKYYNGSAWVEKTLKNYDGGWV